MTSKQQEEFRALSDRMMQRGLIKLNPEARTAEQMKSEKLVKAYELKREREERTRGRFFPQ